MLSQKACTVYIDCISDVYLKNTLPYLREEIRFNLNAISYLADNIYSQMTNGQTAYCTYEYKYEIQDVRMKNDSILKAVSKPIQKLQISDTLRDLYIMNKAGVNSSVELPDDVLSYILKFKYGDESVIADLADKPKDINENSIIKIKNINYINDRITNFDNIINRAEVNSYIENTIDSIKNILCTNPLGVEYINNNQNVIGIIIGWQIEGNILYWRVKTPETLEIQLVRSTSIDTPIDDLSGIDIAFEDEDEYKYYGPYSIEINLPQTSDDGGVRESKYGL